MSLATFKYTPNTTSSPGAVEKRLEAARGPRPPSHPRPQATRTHHLQYGPVQAQEHCAWLVTNCGQSVGEGALEQHVTEATSVGDKRTVSV